MAAPTYGTASTVVASTTSVAVTCPTTSAGNKLLFFASTNGSAISSTLSGWTYEGVVSGGSPAMREALFSRTATGSEGGTVYTVTGMTGGTKGVGYIVQLVPGTGGDTINLTTRSAIDSDSSSTAVSLTAGSSWTSNTNCIIASSYTGLAPSGTYTSSTTSRTIAQTSASITTTARFGAGFSSNTGAYGFQTGAVTSGGTGTPSFTATTVGANWSGVGWLVLAESTAASGGTVNAVAATATAAATAPSFVGGGSVASVAATATAAMLPSAGPVSIDAVTATASAAVQPPAVTGDNNAPVFRASANAQGSSAIKSLSVITPATVQAGDIGIAIAMAGAGSGAPTAPSGWDTTLAHTLTGNGAGAVSVFSRTFVAGDADPNVVWGSAPASGNNTALLVVWFSGAVSLSINTPTTSATASTDWLTGTLTTAGADHLIVAVGAMKASSGTWASTASWSPDATMRATRYGTGAFYPSIVVGDFIQSAAGTTADQTVSWNLSTANAMAFQIDLASSGTDASVSAVVATATGAANAPGTGSQVNVFPPAATSSALAQIPVIFAGTAQTGGGPAIATAQSVAPGVRQRIFVNATATATAAAIAPTPPGSSNVVPGCTADASAVAPLLVTGGALVTGVAATATADALAPAARSVNDVTPATATAGALAPAIGQASVRPSAMVATADGLAPVVGGFLTALVAAATAAVIEPVVHSSVRLYAPKATAAAIGVDPVVGHKEWVFRTPTITIHYRTGNPLLDRIGYPTGTAVLLIDGFYINVEYPDDEQIQAATKTYLGGRDYILSSEELVSLTSAGYGEFISQEVFV